MPATSLPEYAAYEDPVASRLSAETLNGEGIDRSLGSEVETNASVRSKCQSSDYRFSTSISSGDWSGSLIRAR